MVKIDMVALAIKLKDHNSLIRLAVKMCELDLIDPILLRTGKNSEILFLKTDLLLLNGDMIRVIFYSISTLKRSIPRNYERIYYKKTKKEEISFDNGINILPEGSCEELQIVNVNYNDELQKVFQGKTMSEYNNVLNFVETKNFIDLVRFAADYELPIFVQVLSDKAIYITNFPTQTPVTGYGHLLSPLILYSLREISNMKSYLPFVKYIEESEGASEYFLFVKGLDEFGRYAPLVYIAEDFLVFTKKISDRMR